MDHPRAQRASATAALLLLSLVLIPIGPSLGQVGKALTESRLLEYLGDGIDGNAIVSKIQKDGISFPTDEATLSRLKAGGATKPVLDAVREAGKPAPTPEGKLTTFKEVLAALRGKVAEEQILERLKESPTIFAFDEVQIGALRTAGASDRLLEALQGRRPASPGSEVSNIAIILDCSNSMNLPAGLGSPGRLPETKMVAAKRVVAELIRDIPEGLKLAFVAYGHDSRRSCDAIDVYRPLATLEPADKAPLAALIARLPAVGSTPIAGALRVAGRELAKDPAPAGLILISDGVDTCNGDPSAEAARLASTMNLTFGVNVVGFDVNLSEQEKLKEIARMGRGTYYNARNVAEFREVIQILHKRLDGPLVVKTNQGESLRFGSRGSAWADRVVSFGPKGTIPATASDPKEALGLPNYDEKADNRYVALGVGGEIVLEFVDNFLIDGPGPDLAVFEIGPAVEATLVAISEDGKTWVEIGKAAGGNSTINIGPYVTSGQKFRFVRLKDDDNGVDGADIDAIGAINSVPIAK